jgi:hypothetical protein
MGINKSKQMHLITQLASGQGIEQGGWRWPREDKAAFINEDVFIKGAQLAEKGKLDGWNRLSLSYKKEGCCGPNTPAPRSANIWDCPTRMAFMS